MNIENKFLSIKVKDVGAELGSLFDKENKVELLWQGDANFWSGQAPILFPIVGGIKEGKFIHKNKAYELPRHGLARKSADWSNSKIDDRSIRCTLVSNKETLKVYPFDFKLEVIYTLKEKTLNIQHKVTNKGNEEMPFSIGGHPAFNCLVNEENKYSDYSLRFEKEETVSRHFLSEAGLFNNKTELVLENSNTLQLSEALFDKDALVFKDLQSKEITLSGPKGDLLKVSYSDFETIGIWAKPKAPFVCIEPWIGYADTIDSTQNLFDKKGSKVLGPQESFEASYHIEVL